MRVDRKFASYGAALTAALSFLAAGCSEREAPAATSVAPSAPVASTSAGTEIDDTVVTTRVKSALLADPDIHSFDLKVETRKGEVQLSGFVDNQAQIDKAIVVARAVEGVTGVENNVSMKASDTTVGNAVDDGVITTKVKSALLGDDSVKSFDIAVVTRKGKVQLSGFVDNQVQIDQALSIARAVEGVSSVEDGMSVKK